MFYNMKDKKIIVLLLCMLFLASNIATYHFTSSYFTSMSLTPTEDLEHPEESPGDAQNDSIPPDEFRLFLRVYQTLLNRYFEKVPPGLLMKGAIEGMIGSLDDPQTYFLDEEELENLYIKISGTFSGIGIEVSMIKDRVTVIAPIKGGPGEKAGLAPGDQILAVDGESLEGVSLGEAVNRMRGPENTLVHLTVKREGISETLEFEVIRRNIILETVSSKILEEDIGYIQITNFDEHTGYHFKHQLERLEEENNMKGLVIDLRDNPGGVLQGAVEIGETLLSAGPITFMVDAAGEVVRSYESYGEGKDYPIVVLVNEYSASASEVIAGALQDSGAAVLVGTNTYGKATVQNIEKFHGDDVGMRFTVAKYLTPSRKDIHRVGLEPDIPVELPEIFNHYRFPFTREMMLGDYGDDVKILQSLLELLGYPREVEGFFDEKMEENLKDFQRKNGLQADGIFAGSTIRVLRQSVEEKLIDLDSQLNAALDYIHR